MEVQIWSYYKIKQSARIDLGHLSNFPSPGLYSDGGVFVFPCGWLSYGNLRNGVGHGGLSNLNGNNRLGNLNWNIATRQSDPLGTPRAEMRVLL